jgi:threonine/homoserine/homoserine lactone efflux protein
MASRAPAHLWYNRAHHDNASASMAQLPIELQGMMIGLSIAAPVGPIGVLCMRRTLAAGRANGLASGLGAAAADAIYASIAGFGLSALSDLLLRYQNPLRFIGGIFLLLLGVRTFLARPAQRAATALVSGSLLGAFASTFVLTLTNPVTILAFLGIFAGLGLAQAASNYAEAARLVCGVFVGSSLWWLTLSTATSLLRSKLTDGVLLWVNRLSGLVIGAFGLAALVSLLPLSAITGV